MTAVISNWAVMGKIAQADIGGATAKLVLMRMALAINTKRGDFVVWPSIGLVARDTHLSRSSVQRAQRALSEMGLISVMDSARQWRTTRWRIEVAALDDLRFPKYRVSARRPNFAADTWTLKDERQYQKRRAAV